MTNENRSESLVDALDKIGQTLKAGEESKAVLKAIDKLREDLENKAAEDNKAVMEALDKLYDLFASYSEPGDIEYPKIANGPVELVLAFNNHEHIKLEGPDEAPYFSSHGPLTDLQFNEIPGSWVDTTFPVDPSKFGETGTWPPTQVQPFDRPPVDNTNTTNHGYSKQAYFFNDHVDSFVTVGPSLPKIVRTSNGGAQFWVGSIGVIAQGTGKYEGARGVTTYVGSGYFDYWPTAFPEQIALLRAGFKALIGTYLKVVLRDNVAEQSSGEDSPPAYEESQGTGDEWEAAQQDSEASIELGEEERDFGGQPKSKRRRS
ncbi:MAG: hypothetical protein AUG51_14420 [Acidobacteria bacterium 13_1_20CM_3_53_8]|nr:MAG: hypothetical protein AUG51_14420 [Acidobacteria bacterium 13_1_20CM_3_53_8]